MSDVRSIYARRELLAIQERWDARAPTWDAILDDPSDHINDGGGYARFLTVARRALAQIDGIESAAVLDLACGSGRVAAGVQGIAGSVTGVDLSPRMIERAQAQKLRNTIFEVGDCFGVAQASGAFAAVLSRGVILSHYGVRQAPELLSEIRRLLVPGGVVVLDYLRSQSKRPSGHVPTGKHLYTEAEIGSLLGDAGFAVRRRSGLPDDALGIVLAFSQASCP